MAFPFGDKVATANIYIDGFNLYNGCVKKTQCKWLDIGALCVALFPTLTIGTIHYFTSPIVKFRHDPGAPTRQAIYLRALATIPNLVIHKEGWFATTAKLLPQYPLAYRPPLAQPTRPPQLVQVQRLEEKRTDVDIATTLLVDGFKGAFDEAVVISNDSDLAPAIEAVRNVLGKPVGVVNPHPKGNMSGTLIKIASWHYRTINKRRLTECQFPAILLDSEGKTITKPPEW